MNKLIQILLLIIVICSCSVQLNHNTKNQKEIIPFELSQYNNLIFKTILNGKDTLSLKFDSGTTGLLLTHDAIRKKTNLLTNKNDSTQNYVKLDTTVSLQIGKLRWDNLEVYPVTLSGQGTDGRFGWDLFKEKIVLLDYDKMIMSIQEKLPNVSNFTSTKLIKTKSVLTIDGEIIVKNVKYKGPFLFDTGYQKALLLDSLLMDQQSFPKDLSVIKINKLRNGAGDVFITKVVDLPNLNIVGQTLHNIPTQLLNKSNPAGINTHILGNELLKRFNTVLDFKEMIIYFQKNSLHKQPYSDAR
jgi:hypothetical protein